MKGRKRGTEKVSKTAVRFYFSFLLLGPGKTIARCGGGGNEDENEKEARQILSLLDRVVVHVGCTTDHC